MGLVLVGLKREGPPSPFDILGMPGLDRLAPAIPPTWPDVGPCDVVARRA
jgi:hypothetical protein